MALWRALPPPSTLDLDVYALPHAVGSRTSSASSSEAQVVSHQQLQLSDQQILSKLFALNAVVGVGEAVQFEHLQDVHLHSIQQLENLGVVSVQHDDFGSSLVAVEPSRVQWQSVVAVEEPTHVVRLLDQRHVLKRSKLSLLLSLREEGWLPDEDVTSEWTPSGPKTFRPLLSQPLSYFAVLLSRDEVLRKGINGVRHGAPDNYYRCLLLLSAEACQAMIRDAAGKDDAWFRARLASAPDAMEEATDSLLDVEAVEEFTSEADAVRMDVLMLPISVSSALWSRCKVDLGEGIDAIKVYFDNCTHQFGRQRGWVNCSHHGCIKYEFVKWTKEYFMSFMYCWHSHGSDLDLPNKQLHLSFSPSEDDVLACVRRLRLRPF